MRKGLLIIGAVLLVVAVILFLIYTLMMSSGEYGSLSATLQPGERVEIGTITSSEVLTVSYMDSINKPLQPYVTAGNYYESSKAGGYVVMYILQSGEGTLYLVNNYTEPVSITALVKVSPSPYSTESEAMGGVIFLAGLAGIVLLILGAVLKPRKKQ